MSCVLSKLLLLHLEKFIFTEHISAFWAALLKQGNLSICYYQLAKKNTFLKNFSYWLLPTNSEHCEIFKSIYYEEHLQTAASNNVLMKLKKKLFIKSLSLHFEKEIYQYVNISLQKNTFSEKDLVVAASYKKTPVLDSRFSSEYYEIFKLTYFICVPLLLKMCLWN